jgi:hypothetical protein
MIAEVIYDFTKGLNLVQGEFELQLKEVKA